MTWLMLRALLRKIPGVAYVVALCVALLLLAGWSLYRTGYSHAEVDMSRIAVQDSVDHAVSQVDTATQATERNRKIARKLVQWGDSSRVTRQELRAAVDSIIAELPEPVVSLIRQDDAHIRRDSATISAFVAVDSAWVGERARRIALDTIMAHQVDVGRPAKRSHHLVMFVSGALAGAALLLVAGAVAR